MSHGRNSQYSEDIFEDSRMSFGEHIEDLRTHLLRALFWFVVCLVASFFVGKAVLRFIAKPVEEELAKYWHKYYEERASDIEKELSEGNKVLAEKNQPIPIRNE